MNKEREKGFTLIEILAVLIILGFFVAMVAKVMIGKDAQRDFDETRKRMKEIKKALLSDPGAYVQGQRQFIGYIPDMGRLPVLNGDGQPEELWSQGLLPDWGYQGNDSWIWCGWRGPYLEVPPDNILRDSWGNPFIFSITEGEMTIKSLGRDGTEGGSGYNEDLILTIEHTEYMAPVAGEIDGFEDRTKVRVRIYYTNNGIEAKKTIGGLPSLQAGYFFRFEKDASGIGTADLDIPIGVGTLIAWEESTPGTDPETDNPDGGEKQKKLTFSSEPTLSWIGTLKIE